MAAEMWASTPLPYECVDTEAGTQVFTNTIASAVRDRDAVVDVRTGTELLFFVAVVAGAEDARSAEVDRDLAAALAVSAALNVLEEVLDVPPGNAIQLDVSRSADVGIAELIETGLMAELQVDVIRQLRQRGVIGRHTKLVPPGHRTSVDPVDFDDTFYGFRIALAMHEQCHDRLPATGLVETRVEAVSDAVVISELDFEGGDLPERIDMVLERSTSAGCQASAVRLRRIADRKETA